MTRRLALTLLVSALSTRLLPAQEPDFATHDLTQLPWVQLNPSLRARAVVGRVGTFAMGESSPGPARKPHHHTYEQINVGLAGTAAIQIADQSFELGELGATLTPYDVEHVLQYQGRLSQLLEFQPVRRLDLLPARTPVSLPVAPAAVAVPAGWPLHSDFSPRALGWTRQGTGVTKKAAKGRTSAMTVWRIDNAARLTFDLDLQLPGAEQFVYVVEGRIQLARGTHRAEGSPDSVVVSGPDATPVRAVATGQPAVVLVLEAISGGR